MATNSYPSLIACRLPSPGSLHLVKHFRKGLLELQGLLDLVCRDVRILAIFQEAGTLMLANELDERRHIGLPVLRKAFQVLEYGRDATLGEQRHCVVGIFVELGIEDALVHEVGILADVE